MAEISSPKPHTAWPQIGDIIPNHDGGRPDPSTELDGQQLVFQSRDGRSVQLAFGLGELQWNEAGNLTLFRAEVFAVREGVYFVDLLDRADSYRTLCLVIDLQRGGILIVEGRVPPQAMPDLDLLTRTERLGSQSLATIAVSSGTLVGRSEVEFLRTSRLSGKYIRYHYSETHVYDHYYVSDRYYMWQCWRGPDAGLGDYEELDCFDCGEDLTLVCWREKLLPCLAIMLEDHRSMRSIGKVFGADAHDWSVGNTTVGAEFQVLTTIPPVPNL